MGYGLELLFCILDLCTTSYTVFNIMYLQSKILLNNPVIPVSKQDAVGRES